MIALTDERRLLAYDLRLLAAAAEQGLAGASPGHR
jgi:hypothetical protein